MDRLNLSHENWITIQLPFKKISILTLPETMSLKGFDDIYSYMFELKQLFEKIINRIKK